MGSDRPRCKFEREYGPGYTCASDHCPTCGAHHVWTSKTESTPRCLLEGTGCQPPLEEFA